MIWYISVISLVALFVWLSLKFTPQLAIGVVGVISFAWPAWIMLPLFNVPADTVVGSGVDVKVAVATATLLLYCVMPGRTFPVRLVACDYAMIGVVVMHMIGDGYNSGFRWNDLFRAYAEWYAPYVAGRVAFQRTNEALILTKLIAATAAVLGILAMIEAFSGYNPMELWAGVRPLEGAYRGLERWGFKRAYGPYFHPLYFGVIQCLFMGATLYVAVLAFRQQLRPAWAFCPLISFLGILCTGSRGPIAGAVLLCAAILVVMVPRVRIPAFLLAACLVMVAVWQRDAVVQTLERWSGEANDRFDQSIEVGGKRQKYSGSRSRLLVLTVYGKALSQAGLLGFGTDRVTGFPIRIPLSGQAAELIKTMETIENAYLLIALRFGWLGLIAFATAILLSLIQWLRLSRDLFDENSRFAAVCLGSATWATALLILTVWMPHEIGFPFIWSLGASSGLYLSHRTGYLL